MRGRSVLSDRALSWAIRKRPHARPDQHNIDFAPAGWGEELFTEFALCSTGTNLFDLSQDGPAALRRVLPHGAICNGSVCRRAWTPAHTARLETFSPVPDGRWPKTLFVFSVPEARLAAISGCPRRRALSYCFRPCDRNIILRSHRGCIAPVVPQHPLCRAHGQFRAGEIPSSITS
ncbi:MAG: hypothetical protein JWN34_1573 [Bryobacterales bacterium]|nr:hypothetical protein [Bryobacterales bacterium]